MNFRLFPFALSLSKGRFFFGRSAAEEVRGFDKLSPNGFGGCA